mmetsp:Transcript_18376/g.64538  ORF Transcript_18376/g.64538 Transcript_18376/m.64538 type:complete len:325 (-) Transcript_18376:43-1017(-)
MGGADAACLGQLGEQDRAGVEGHPLEARGVRRHLGRHPGQGGGRRRRREGEGARGGCRRGRGGRDGGRAQPSGDASGDAAAAKGRRRRDDRGAAAVQVGEPAGVEHGCWHAIFLGRASHPEGERRVAFGDDAPPSGSERAALPDAGQGVQRRRAGHHRRAPDRVRRLHFGPELRRLRAVARPPAAALRLRGRGGPAARALRRALPGLLRAAEPGSRRSVRRRSHEGELHGLLCPVADRDLRRGGLAAEAEKALRQAAGVGAAEVRDLRGGLGLARGGRAPDRGCRGTRPCRSRRRGFRRHGLTHCARCMPSRDAGRSDAQVVAR